MTASGPEPPEGFEPQPLDYPAYAGLPPPVYPPPYPGYYQPNPGYPPFAPAAGTNGKAIAALVTSLAGLICCGLPSVIGLVLGLVAMRETKRRGQDGYGLAVAAVVISTLIMMGYVLYVAVTAVLYARN
ncbi:hypothetical protein NGTWS0302_13840 [Mycolicibacterium cyprinidarum]|uniref:DUF4190 domain-containing protein n=1 Tax=Mycolicibacterium cyprinidarum TaxID=2860311 RepID=A0ABQ4V9X3_9MYCO|nr:hypothetical protein NGTWS1702_19360 [Mycolicibacterium sp. NGTWSNA01]GJF17302.1 hypothetical protein NGTWS0302_13840 [Mycolicibacterium sp. NGTWS0302]GJF17681.1 hypothetical protein NGTWS1803_35710 [Mycolicibacterium sp. NGTWS1803]